jgi:hypothetical protein
MEENSPPQKPQRKAGWHDKAREMRAHNMSYAKIGEACGVSAVAVYFLFNPHKRLRSKKEDQNAFKPIRAVGL